MQIFYQEFKQFLKIYEQSVLFLTIFISASSVAGKSTVLRELQLKVSTQIAF